jgi:hypothetical protein
MNATTFPPHFLEQLNAEPGFDKANFVEAHQNGSTITSIRLNPFKPSGIKTDKQVPWCADGRYLDTRPSFTFDPLFMRVLIMYRRHRLCL